MKLCQLTIHVIKEESVVGKRARAFVSYPARDLLSAFFLALFPL